MSGKHLRVARNGELKAWRSGDKTYSQNPANFGANRRVRGNLR